MNIPSFDKFNINSVTEEMTATDRMQKGNDLNDKLTDLKKQLQDALDKKDNKKADVLQVKIDIAQLDIKKFNLQKKLESLSK
jgi:hypothetical protein